ncbi:MFS transporter [Vulcanimicrobium alpinum]|uniref:MFS transporter n=1 Tax=Vulcanimicrobium alpinum TaxID=3016050 RepID=A0AAN1XWQ8_UNVUL|nr:MFS transporter [Vulcanimicrobium alpinum]BDE06800.1 MFS transporter [Vulcanimicrobium alpinum]
MRSTGVGRFGTRTGGAVFFFLAALAMAILRGGQGRATIIPDHRRVAKTWVLIAAIVGSAMSFIDGTAVNVALPILQKDFGADGGAVQWVVEGYSLFLSSLILLGGSLGDLYGRKRCFLIGVGIFAFASLGCAFAPSIDVLIVARCLQGVGGALMMPESLALISATFTGAERGRAIGTWSAFASITGAAGPIIGGYLAQHASWRWVFLLNLPLAVVVFAVSWRGYAESRDEEMVRRLDVAGAVLATIALGLLTFGLIHSEGAAPDALAWSALVASVVLGAAFVVVERRSPAPMLPLRLFRSKTFSGANVYTLLLYAAIGGSLYFLPFVLIDVHGYAPSAAGAALLPFILLQFFLARWSGGLIARFGARLPLLAGALIAALGFAAFALPGLDGSYWTTFFPAAVLLGIGGVFFVAPLTTTVFDAVDTAESGVASGVNNAVARTAGLLAIALFGFILAGVFVNGMGARVAREHLSPATQRVVHDQIGKLYGGSVPRDVPARDRDAVARAVREGYLAGFRAVMGASVIVCVLAAGVALVSIPGRLRSA